MSWRHGTAGVLLGLALAVSLPGGAGAGPAAPAPPVPPAAPALPPPQWVGGTDARGKAQLTWILNPALAGVRVYRRDEGPGSVFQAVADSRENTWLDAGVQPGRTYRYRLTGLGPDGREGRPSAEIAVRIAAVVLRPPTTPEWEGFLLVDDGVGLKWQANEGEDVIAWNVYRRSPPDAEYRLIGSSLGTSFRDTAVEPGREYGYALTALDSGFRETPLSKDLAVKVARPAARPEAPGRPTAWKVRRTRLLALVKGGDQPFERPADVAVGPATGSVYVADSGRNLVVVLSPLGVYQRTVGAKSGGGSVFRNLLGLALDRDETLFAVDAGGVQSFSPLGRPGRRVEVPRREREATGLIDAAIGADGRLFVVDNFNHRFWSIGGEETRAIGRHGALPAEFSAPTFCDVDAQGNLFVADGLNARVQVFSAKGEFVRSFGRYERGPGGFGRPKGVAVGAGGEVYVADSWLNTVQVFDDAGRFVALLGDETGRPLDLGSPNGVALGPGNRVYIAERLASRVQVRELIDVPEGGR